MKRTIIILSVSVLIFSLNSCKKKQGADELRRDERNEQQPFAAPQPDPYEELVKEAKSKPLTSLALSENLYEFGKIKKGETVKHTYEVTNTGTNPLIISAVKPGCGCTVPDYTKDPILPGKKGKITLKFDSSNFDGLIHKSADVYANVKKTPITIAFNGNIVE